MDIESPVLTSRQASAYLRINDGDVDTAAYVYRLEDNNNANTAVEGSELTLIGTLTTDANATTTTEVVVA